MLAREPISLSEVKQTIGPWMAATFCFGLAAGAPYETKWLSMSAATAASFCATKCGLLLLRFYWRKFLGRGSTKAEEII
jgi:hypothetical protein